ncbi:MAG: BatD family protein [Xanthomonadaceae bacterium]|nr:BatD family protein [Xanthomonadaceae bacterium]MDP2185783.1 BatD family protein [Xanthomonadales bacterium]MDZ4114666.1 BatD family protein [Xanthomonadaceae bacterium]MDZ4376696.1 BatD family protein [Xanthomonadaceae bacterium]
MNGLQRLLGVLLLLMFVAEISAAPRAWLDRSQINQGDTVTLNIESENKDAPDFTVLEADFALTGQSSQTQTTISNGSISTRTLWAVALEPRKTGVLSIPAIRVGNESTAPLALTVSSAPVGQQAQGQDVFLEVQVDSKAPYVGQAVIYTLRLNYAITLLDGDLDTPQIDGADFRRIGDDASYQRMIAGRRYQTLERHFVMSPERSGELILSAPRFRGRTLAGLRDSIVGGARAISAMGESLTLDVRPQPAQATMPWFPARALSMERSQPDSDTHVGEPVSVELRMQVEGALVTQVPELSISEVPGLRVFPDVAKVSERLIDGVLHAEVSRRFALVASRAGAIQVPAMQVGWWNTVENKPELAKVAGFTLQLGAAIDSQRSLAASTDAVAALPPKLREPVADAGQLWRWQLFSAMLLLLWLATLALAWRRGALRGPPHKSVDAARTSGEDGERALRRALANDDLAGVDSALRRIADGQPLDALLDGPAQREAVAMLRSALWGQGDRAAAREALRNAFAGGVRLRAATAESRGDEPLPPLYPR